MQKGRNQEIDITLQESQKKTFLGNVITPSLEDFKERQKEKRRRDSRSDAGKVMAAISTYLKAHNIYFETDRSEGIPRITMVFKNCHRCPGNITEGCIYFFEDGMEVRVYYSELGSDICRKSKNLPELYRLINFLHARLWARVTDGMNGVLYKSQYLICPRFYVTEDGMSDITATMLIPYTYFDFDMLEIEDFITAALPELLDKLSTPVFLLLMAKINIDEAISMVESGILGKGGKR